MKKTWELDPPAFEKMLAWLDKDRHIAGQKYEAIRLRLIKVLHYRGCLDGEELADIVFDRVARKVDSLAETYEGDPAYYFLNVANKVYLEYRRKPELVELPTEIAGQTAAGFADDEDVQPEYECLKQCLADLREEKRELIVGYYREEKKAKIDNHRKIAEAAGIETATLHVRAYRLRVILQKCVLKCLAEKN